MRQRSPLLVEAFEMRKIMIMGTGAQGSTIAARLQEEPSVEEIVCADYDVRAAQELEKTLSKAKAVQVDGEKLDEIVKAAERCELIVNGLPPDFNMRVMDACVAVGASYLDMASGNEEDPLVDAMKAQLDRDQEFADAGITALMNCGSAPGIANLIAREATDKLDSVDTIDILAFEGVWTTKFVPFWWSPETALDDMVSQPVVYQDGKHVLVPPFNNPEWVDFVGLGKRKMYDHHHEEPVSMGLLADRYLKGAKNINFRYGGAKSLYDMGLLSDQPVDVDGQKVVPIDLIEQLTPPAPSSRDEVAKAIEGGIEADEGIFLVRVDGSVGGRDVRIDSYLSCPGLQDSFDRAGISHESYLTGQCAYLFTLLLVRGKIDQKGVFPPEALDAPARAYYLEEAAKFDLTVDEVVQRRLF
jgi:saccharopine dehydrogenase-like NADP-dependent oxidoreductase